jgi:hypothetical protein
MWMRPPFWMNPLLFSSFILTKGLNAQPPWLQASHRKSLLKIANRGKDLFIEQMQKEWNGFFDQLLTASRKMGELETKLLQIESNKNPQT